MLTTPFFEVLIFPRANRNYFPRKKKSLPGSGKENKHTHQKMVTSGMVFEKLINYWPVGRDHIKPPHDKKSRV
jgi:hypothetical protein